MRRDQVMEEGISQFYHEHPLILTQNVSNLRNPNCYGCCKPVANLEMVYICVQEGCDDGYILHKKCGELPNQISDPQHSKHPLDLFYFNTLGNYYNYDKCDSCGFSIHQEFGFRCSDCNFNLHIKCVEGSIEERKELQHPSHPRHSLTLIRKPRFSFRCDGCGDQDADTAYICSTCEFFLHKSCASLPDILRIDSHPHSLSLIFSLPKKHIKYRYRCDVCSEYCNASRWAYFCGDCRYIVHIKCAIRLTATKPDLSNSGEDDRGVIEFPLHVNDIYDKLITPFVMTENIKGVDGATSTSISTGACCDPSFLLKYYHEHPLSLVSEFTHKDDDGEEEDEEDKEEELKICDVCVTPISSPPYYQCNAYPCTYSIHSICSMLPLTLQYSSTSSNVLNSLLLLLGECNETPNKNHNFTLNKSKGRYTISRWFCDLCYLPTNGMGYKCGDCGTMIDVKCASLPTSIRHASHTRCHHEPLILTEIPTGGARKSCYVCDTTKFYERNAYFCSHESCDFALHLQCAMLPSSIKDREWDKHPLMLTSEASLDHPSDFYCELCEEEMHPKSWMYHCRHCDASLHLNCLGTGSRLFRNMKLGQPCMMDEIHPNHPLTFTCVTLKKRCDACGWYVHTWLGYECASCYYVVCLYCGAKELRKKLC